MVVGEVEEVLVVLVAVEGVVVVLDARDPLPGGVQFAPVHHLGEVCLGEERLAAVGEADDDTVEVVGFGFGLVGVSPP
jgi:hypothetical protein